MKNDKKHITPIVIEIADYIYANPTQSMTKILSHFVKICQKSDRTVRRLVKRANAYNESRLTSERNIKNDLFIEAKQKAQKAIISREKIIEELLSDFNRLKEIIAGSAYMAKDKQTGNTVGYMQASYSDEIRALSVRKEIAKQIADIEGFNAAIKIAETDSKGDDIIGNINVNIRKYDN
ncbi:MAG: hypothetical protein LBP63_10865 [Prevotellaceae bacterium]|jgi:hypothetical protein|nr:hypothetical protein [Prevotellaceae bacterium]